MAKEKRFISPRMKAKKLYRQLQRRVPEKEDIGYLNITPMMDMMTIILVFLLVKGCFISSPQ